MYKSKKKEIIREINILDALIYSIHISKGFIHILGLEDFIHISRG